MANIHRVLWGEGVFLRPQHFQQQALYSEWLGQNAARLARSYAGAAGIHAGTFRHGREGAAPSAPGA